MSSAKGKVQLLRLQANKSRRDNLAKFDGRVSLALSTKYGVTPPTAAKTGDAGNSSSSSSSSNFDPPLFVVFDWVAFSRKVRQQYYEQLKTDFPGEFIYISASDDFVGLQGTVCCIARLCDRHRILSVTTFLSLLPTAWQFGPPVPCRLNLQKWLQCPL